jgi:hypothetical protein
MQTKLVVFKNGLEVVAQTQVDDADDHFVILKNPVQCAVVPNQDHSGAEIKFGPISPILDPKQTLRIAANEILFMANLIDDVRNAYDGAFGGGIITANPNTLQKLQL